MERPSGVEKAREGLGGMSPPGRPKGEYRSAQREGGQHTIPLGRPKLEYRSAQREDTPASARRDLAILVAGATLFAVLSVRVELSEMLAEWLRPHESMQLDELPGVLLFIALGLAWYAARRVAEVRSELLRRRTAEQGLREALAQNRKLALAAAQAQDDERRNLARELHDELGQYLNAVKIDAVCLSDASAEMAPAVGVRAIAIAAMTDRMEGVVRDMVRRLRPAGLDELGLAAALENCIDSWRQRLPGVQFRVALAADLDCLDEATNMTLYRLVQEGLTNIAKHANAESVEILMVREAMHQGAGPEVILRMRDDGVGRVTNGKEGNGLAGMRERVELLSGKFKLEAFGERGFGFTARIPLQQEGVC